MELNEGISIVVPFLNEEEGMRLFCETMDRYAETARIPLELIFVNDGSTDDSADILREYKFHAIENAVLIDFSKNFGSHAAIRAGLQYAKYSICTWMGSDLQEPLEMLEQSYERIQAGFDAVYISKKTIKVRKSTRLFSRIYSQLMRKYAVKNYTSNGVSTIVFNNKIKDFLNENIESNSSIMLQIIDAGFKTTVLEMDFHERSAGESKWTLYKKIKLFIDSFVAFSFAPIRLVSLLGIFMFFIGMIIGVITIINRICNNSVPSGYSTLASILGLGFGVTNISLGIVAEYLWRTYDAARKRPVFIISSVESLSAGALNGE